MIAGLKSYPSYKESGLVWLSEVPMHWNVRRVKTILIQRSQKGFANEPLLAATQTKGVVRKTNYEKRTVLAQKDLHKLKLVQVDDFVISLRSFQGGIEYARERGIISPAYTVLYPKNSNNQRYLAWLFKSNVYIENLKLHVTGIREGQNIDYEKLSRSELPLPSLPEQQAIVRFLNYVDQNIRKFIRNKETLIRLLEEQKQAVIHQAVTHGLIPNVQLKSLGSEWLGDFPDHWEIHRLKSIVSNITDMADDCNEDEIYLALENVESWTGEISTNDTEVEFDSKVKRFVSGDVLFGKLRPYLAKVTCPSQPGVCVGEFLVLRPKNNNLMSRFLEYYIRTKPIINMINAATFGAKMPRTDWGFLGNIPLLLPPINEQRKIVKHIGKISNTFEKTIRKERSEIHLFYEYRKRMITDVVSGKIDVREAADHLLEDPCNHETSYEVNYLLNENGALTDEIDPLTEEMET